MLKQFASGSQVSKKRKLEEENDLFGDCKEFQAKKQELKLLKNNTQKRKAKLHRDIGRLAMEKDAPGAMAKALEYLAKSWKVCGLTFQFSNFAWQSQFFQFFNVFLSGFRDALCETLDETRIHPSTTSRAFIEDFLLLPSFGIPRRRRNFLRKSSQMRGVRGRGHVRENYVGLVRLERSRKTSGKC